jgi:hypothetical protein
MCQSAPQGQRRRQRRLKLPLLIDQSDLNRRISSPLRLVLMTQLLAQHLQGAFKLISQPSTLPGEAQTTAQIGEDLPGWQLALHGPMPGRVIVGNGCFTVLVAGLSLPTLRLLADRHRQGRPVRHRELLDSEMKSWSPGQQHARLQSSG